MDIAYEAQLKESLFCSKYSNLMRVVSASYGPFTVQGCPSIPVKRYSLTVLFTPAAPAVVRRQDRAVLYVRSAVTDGEVQLGSFGCICCDVWRVMSEAVTWSRQVLAGADPLRRPARMFRSSTNSWRLSHVSNSICTALSEMSHKLMGDRSFRRSISGGEMLLATS